MGTGASRVLGEIAAYVGFLLLAVVGLVMIRSSLQDAPEPEFEPTHGVGLLTTSLSISLDSLYVAVALPRSRYHC